MPVGARLIWLAVLGLLAAVGFRNQGKKQNKRKKRAKKQSKRRGSKMATKKRAFTSFDYDHDEDLRTMLVGQAKNPDTPFDLADWSVKEPFTGNWREKVRSRIRGVDVVIVICGEHTRSATGVAAEVEIAREENIPYFLLRGRRDKQVTKPTSALSTDKIYEWTWDNLKVLIRGAR
jgi:hypothetical protein